MSSWEGSSIGEKKLKKVDDDEGGGGESQRSLWVMRQDLRIKLTALNPHATSNGPSSSITSSSMSCTDWNSVRVGT